MLIVWLLQKLLLEKYNIPNIIVQLY